MAVLVARTAWYGLLVPVPQQLLGNRTKWSYWPYGLHPSQQKFFGRTTQWYGASSGVLDDPKLACFQKGHAIREGLLGRHYRNYSALRDDHAPRDRRPVGAGTRRGKAHEPANATAEWRRCVGACRCGGARSLARCRDAGTHGDRTLAYQLDPIRPAGQSGPP